MKTILEQRENAIYYSIIADATPICFSPRAKCFDIKICFTK